MSSLWKGLRYYEYNRVYGDCKNKIEKETESEEMSAGWSENGKGICNNPKCKQDIYWNSLVRHPETGRQRPLNSPYYPDTGAEPDIHECMKKKPPGQFINKYQEEDRIKELKKPPEELFPNIPRPYPPGVKLGITHLYVNNQFVYLYKCPYCPFQNIYESEIDNHITFTMDKRHEDKDLSDKSRYIVK
jgi:hypothetical protein